MASLVAVRPALADVLVIETHPEVPHYAQFSQRYGYNGWNSTAMNKRLGRLLTADVVPQTLESVAQSVFSTRIGSLAAARRASR